MAIVVLVNSNFLIYNFQIKKCIYIYIYTYLVPIDITNGIQVLYIFVDIQIDLSHLIETIKFNFTNDKRLALVSTIQFAPSIHIASRSLQVLNYQVKLPQAKPLSPGEILGCTSPKLTDTDVLIYVGDGRFHIESAMIANEKIDAYKYLILIYAYYMM